MLEAGAPRWQRYSGRETVFAHPRILSASKAVSVQLLPRCAMLARHPDPGFRPASTSMYRFLVWQEQSPGDLLTKCLLLNIQRITGD